MFALSLSPISLSLSLDLPPRGAGASSARSASGCSTGLGRRFGRGRHAARLPRSCVSGRGCARPGWAPWPRRGPGRSGPWLLRSRLPRRSDSALPAAPAASTARDTHPRRLPCPCCSSTAVDEAAVVAAARVAWSFPFAAAAAAAAARGRVEMHCIGRTGIVSGSCWRASCRDCAV